MTYYEESENLAEIIQLATMLDRRRLQRGWDKQANTSRSLRPRHTQEGGDAMELDSLSRDNKDKSKKGKGNRKANNKWTDQQKERFNKNLYIHCGDK
ncbi:uncharacterized protein K452DRAFT_331785 [Aplosporella prunicola CBS 121167]|uniref:Uncharacterized protein n=1 Tax=Aplosporella prunicola CBS 121167 TaxID=1176127 RepID=A0A6A6BG33_9PEZI|nr:uncharacterized protein K452DRAFT_331785 [Aplosporella prunicola CBS 121167]KAF2143112.1 hypothetical protein K452DRAFT_331785 [Aplosporella prunicola CBS 121167]